MSLGSELITLFGSAPTLTALVGSRVYHSASASPTTVKPYLVFDIISQIEEEHLTGSAGLQRCVVQFRSIAATMAVAFQVLEALRTDIHTLRKNTGAIRSARAQTVARSAYQQPQQGEAVGICSAEADYEIWRAVDQPSPI